MRLTKRQAQVISAYTGISLCDFEYIQEYAQELLNRPVWTHEFADEKMFDELKKLSKEEFLSICYKGESEWQIEYKK